MAGSFNVEEGGAEGVVRGGVGFGLMGVSYIGIEKHQMEVYKW